MKLDTAEVQEIIANDPHMLLVDVRGKEEFDAGHIPGAGCMPAMPAGMEMRLRRMGMQRQ